VIHYQIFIIRLVAGITETIVGMTLRNFLTREKKRKEKNHHINDTSERNLIKQKSRI